eukprot:CAMPEP_0197591412 /NCGR_PEP_ID=MMETSP1326-20131121/13161_1 /TAXON_ID=1155430 /ORGANISM="Genus nov. species nov., Strain RCC2288" /LENGTH=193 /DNA_ID=CAMNT_0043156845 /DNA_START=296 /DNA_END=874 /DNA_ORIENTATION=-
MTCGGGGGRGWRGVDATPSPPPPAHKDAATASWREAPVTKGDAWFDAAYQESKNGIIRIDKNGATFAFYRRVNDDVATFRPYFYFYNNWFSWKNKRGTDMNIYNTYAGALDRTASDRWITDSYDDPGVGFPRDMGGGWMGVDTTPYRSSATACDEVMAGSGFTCNEKRFTTTNGYTLYLEEAVIKVSPPSPPM